MSGFTRQTFINLVLVLLSFGGSLAAAKAMKRVSMNNQLCSLRPTVISLNLD